MLRHLTLALGLIVCAAAGCYETTVSLTTPQQAKVDQNAVGDWKFPAADGDKAFTLIIRNFDDHAYYTEWFGDENKDPTRAAAMTIPIKDATFAQLREITDDGSIPDKYLLLRFTLKGDKLGIRQLKKEFFDDHPSSNADELRKTLESNLDNQAMYDGDMRYATRVTADAKASR